MKSHKYVCGSRKCDVCICEKLLIARGDPYVLFDKRDELRSIHSKHSIIYLMRCTL